MDKLAAGKFFYSKQGRRIKNKNFIFFSLTGILLLLQFSLYSQTPTLQTAVDRKEILIGQQFNLKISATYNPSQAKIRWFTIPDSIVHFDIVDKSRIDTLNAGSNTTLQQNIVLTSFDSGKWKLPALMINFDRLSDGTSNNYFTDSLPVKVSYQPDTTQAVRDIKPIWSVKVFDPFWWYVAGGALLLILIITGIIIYFKKRKKKPAPVFESRLSAYEEARQELDKLKLFNLNVPADIKQYHNRLSEIFRRYSSRKMQTNLMTRTSNDILIELKNRHFTQEQLTKLAAALRTGDAVKFAKYLPPVFESENSLADVSAMIETMQRGNSVKAEENKK